MRLVGTGVQLLTYDGHDIPLGTEGFPPQNIKMRRFAGPVPRSIAGDNGELLASIQVLAGVRFAHGGSYNGLRVIWSDDNGRHTLHLSGRASAP